MGGGGNFGIKESGNEERTLFAAVTRKHQIQAGRVMGGIGSTATVTMLRDALLSTGLYVCLACEARVLGARYQRRETRENVHTTQTTDTDVNTMVALLILVAPVEVVISPQVSGCSWGAQSQWYHTYPRLQTLTVIWLVCWYAEIISSSIYTGPTCGGFQLVRTTQGTCTTPLASCWYPND